MGQLVMPTCQPLWANSGARPYVTHQGNSTVILCLDRLPHRNSSGNIKDYATKKIMETKAEGLLVTEV